MISKTPSPGLSHRVGFLRKLLCAGVPKILNQFTLLPKITHGKVASIAAQAAVSPLTLSALSGSWLYVCHRKWEDGYQILLRGSETPISLGVHFACKDANCIFAEESCSALIFLFFKASTDRISLVTSFISPNISHLESRERKRAESTAALDDIVSSKGGHGAYTASEHDGFPRLRA